MAATLDSLGQWLQRHDLTIDLITVWAMAIGFFIYGCVKAYSWATLRRTRDATQIGVALKRQKLAEAFIGFGMTTLYGMTLYEYYVEGPNFGFWDRTGLRVGLVVAMGICTFYGIRFLYWLRKEAKRGTHGTIPLAHNGDGE